MEVPILEPVRLYLTSDEVDTAVDKLLKSSSEKQVDDSSDWLDQSEFRHAWLAAREIYAAWHEQGSLIWRKAWKENPGWTAAGLKPLSLAEMREEEFDEPSMDTMWRYDWFGWAFRTGGGDTAGLYVYADREEVYLNIWYPELSLTSAGPAGWEPDSGEDEERNTVHKSRWGDKSIDIAPLSEAATSMLKVLAAR